MTFLCWSGCGWPRRVVFIFGKPFMFGGRKKILITTLGFFFFFNLLGLLFLFSLVVVGEGLHSIFYAS